MKHSDAYHRDTMPMVKVVFAVFFSVLSSSIGEKANTTQEFMQESMKNLKASPRPQLP